MDINISYVAIIINSVIRMTTPILLASLTAAVCSKVKIFNIGMEGTMIAGAFFSIVANYYTHSAALSILAGALSGVVISAVVAFCVIKLKASAVVVGMAVNTMMAGVTSYLLYVLFHVKGIFTDASLISLPKITLPVVSRIPVLGTIFDNLTIIDYLAVILAVGIYIFLYKTVLGFRLRALGINPEAARSLGTPVEKYQFITVSLSGVLCGLAGCVLSMGSVTLFIENITSGRGYIAMAANNLGASHPLGVFFASAFFGLCQAVGNALQNTSLKTQITSSIPYLATVLALMGFRLFKERQKKRKRGLA